MHIKLIFLGFSVAYRVKLRLSEIYGESARRFSKTIFSFVFCGYSGLKMLLRKHTYAHTQKKRKEKETKPKQQKQYQVLESPIK